MKQKRTQKKTRGNKKLLTSKVIKKEKGGCERKKSKKYFNKETEGHIVNFIRCKRKDYRNNIFVKNIMPAFQELIDSQIKVYKVHRIEPNIDSIRRDALDFMFMKLCCGNFVAGEHNAFSYFNVIARNFFFEKYAKYMKGNQFSLPIDNLCFNTELEKAEEYRMFRGYNESIEDKVCKNDSINDFIDRLRTTKEEIRPMLEKECLNKNKENIDAITDKYHKVIDGLCELFNDSDNLPSLKKKSIYFYIKELTGVDSRMITEVLDFLKVRYDFLSEAFE